MPFALGEVSDTVNCLYVTKQHHERTEPRLISSIVFCNNTVLFN